MSENYTHLQALDDAETRIGRAMAQMESRMRQLNDALKDISRCDQALSSLIGSRAFRLEPGTMDAARRALADAHGDLRAAADGVSYAWAILKKAEGK